MKLAKVFFVICLTIVGFLSTNVAVKAEGSDCMCMAMCPAEYEPYLVADEFANVMMANIPEDKKEEVKEWMQTPWGRQTFKTISGRNNAFSDLKDLSDLAYTKLEEYYDIPNELQNHFIIAYDFGGKFNFFVDTFGPNINIPDSTVVRINSDAGKIACWMIDCQNEGKLLPLEDYLK